MGPKKASYAGFSIVIENLKGSYKKFAYETSTYPLKGVTYPVDYGYIEGYTAEDEADLDVFAGTGSICGFIKVWRLDVPIETKMVANVTEIEWQAILEAFKPVLKESQQFLNENKLKDYIKGFKNK